LEKPVAFDRVVIDSILTYAKMFHPREGILLLRGKKEKGRILITDVMHMLPIDFTIMGTAHSHPSGVLKPSRADLNNFYGRIMVIAAYPYRAERDIGVFDRSGNRNRIPYEILHMEEEDFW